MPRVRLQDPFGVCFEIATRQTETLLRAWFDEILPYCHYSHAGEEIWPVIIVHPMWLPLPGTPRDPDWLTDSRALGRLERFPAVDGDSGLRELLALRRRLEAELARDHVG